MKVFWFVRATTTKYHRLGDLNKSVLSLSRGWKSKIKASAGLVSPEAYRWLDLHRVFSLCIGIPGVFSCIHIFSSYKDTRHVGFGVGNGDPLQYSCGDNPVDRGAWQATAHRITKSRTQQSDCTHILG